MTQTVMFYVVHWLGYYIVIRYIAGKRAWGSSRPFLLFRFASLLHHACLHVISRFFPVSFSLFYDSSFWFESNIGYTRLASRTHR